MKKSLLLLIISIYSVNSYTQTPEQFFLSANNFFKKYVEDGLVNYKEIHANPKGLNSLIKIMSTMKLAGEKPAVHKAFWINAYNLTVIKSIINHYPVGSPKDIKGFFNLTRHQVAGNSWTINDIENIMIRKQFNDNKIHFVLVCAALGCPKIANFAYFPDKLEKQLLQRTIFTLDDPNFIRVNKQKRTVLISEIFKWYREDFINTGNTFKEFINDYRTEKVPMAFALNYYAYNWVLNEKKN